MYLMVLFIILHAATSCVGDNPQTQQPVRRFYIYSPEIIPHAAAALNMLIPQSFYGGYDHMHYPEHYEEHDEIEDYSEHGHGHGHDYGHGHDSEPIQMVTYIKSKQPKKRVKKRRPNGKKVKRVKKGSKKCMPFKVRFTKKSDVLPISYFPVHKMYRPIRRIIHPSSTWARVNKWKMATPGITVTDYPLQEPFPSATAGAPPASPLYNVYEDNRIPVKEAVVPNYVHLIEKANVYNEPGYYQYGTYQTKTEAPVGVNLTRDGFGFTTERVVTVTPTSAWVPLPKFYRVTQTVSQGDGGNILLTKRCSLGKCWESADGSKDKRGLVSNKI